MSGYLEYRMSLLYMAVVKESLKLFKIFEKKPT